MSGNKQFAVRALLSSGWKSFVSREGGRVRENFWGRVMKCLIKLFLQLNLFILQLRSNNGIINLLFYYFRVDKHSEGKKAK